MDEPPPEDREEWLRYAQKKHAEAEAENNRSKPNGDGRKHSGDDDVRQLRIDIGQLGVESSPEEVSAIIDRIAAEVRDEIVRESLLQTVRRQTGIPVAAMRKRLNEATKAARKKTHPALDWIAALHRDGDGEPYATASNVLIALRQAPEWHGVLALNEFIQRPMFLGKPPWLDDWDKPQLFTDADEARVLVWMQENALPLCRIEAVRQALAVAIDDKRYHPIRDYLENRVWDGVPRLDKMLEFYFGVEPIKNYTGPIGRCWMISAVARIYKPGCQAKYCLILEGEQDLGKSTALEILGGEWYTDDIAELGSKDSALQAGNAWLVELAELDSIRKAHIAAVKAFISRKCDKFRKPFGRNVIDQHRQCIMAGSINPGGDYFVDETGNVRFWPVLCTGIDLASLSRDRDQLWAEAVHRYKLGEKWWLEDEEAITVAREQQDARTQGDSWVDEIRNYLEVRRNVVAVTTRQLLCNALCIDIKDHDRPKQSRVGIIMRRQLRWKCRRNGPHRWFERPTASHSEYPDF